MDLEMDLEMEMDLDLDNFVTKNWILRNENKIHMLAKRGSYPDRK